MKLIKQLIAWLNEPQPTPGCPDPEMHDRNNEARHSDVISTALEFPAVDPIWYPVSVHSAAILEHVNADSGGG